MNGISARTSGLAIGMALGAILLLQGAASGAPKCCPISAAGGFITTINNPALCRAAQTSTPGRHEPLTQQARSEWACHAWPKGRFEGGTHLPVNPEAFSGNWSAPSTSWNAWQYFYW